MLLILGCALGVIGLVLMFAGLVENPALAKFVGGSILFAIAEAIGVKWASTKGPH